MREKGESTAQVSVQETQPWKTTHTTLPRDKGLANTLTTLLARGALGLKLARGSCKLLPPTCLLNLITAIFSPTV